MNLVNCNNFQTGVYLSKARYHHALIVQLRKKMNYSEILQFKPVSIYNQS